MNSRSRAKNEVIVKKIVPLIISFIISQVLFNTSSNSEIAKRVVCNSPITISTLDLVAMGDLSEEVWEKRYILFNNPRAACMLGSGNTNDIFFVDSYQNRMQYLNVYEDAYGYREAQNFKIFGPTYNNVDYLNNPVSITRNDDGDAYYKYIYILDAGDNSILKVKLDKSGDTSFTNLGYIYDQQDSLALNNPRDIDYCDLPGATHDILIVADSGNNRILILKPDGTLIRSLYGDDLMYADNFEFDFPNAVVATRLNEDTCEALIYVYDSGSNSLVAIYQDTDWDYYLWRMMDFDDIPDFEVKYITDIELDDHDGPGTREGIFVLDGAAGRIFRVDPALGSVIETFDEFDSPGIIYDLMYYNGELGVLSPLTADHGLEIFEVRASISDVKTSPNPFEPPIEWMTLEVTVTALSDMTAIVKEKDSGTTVDTLYNTYAFPGKNYAMWDGKDYNDNDVSAGQYTITVQIGDEYLTQYTDSIEVEVEVGQAPLKLLATNKEMSHPQFSPEGRRIAYMSDAHSGSGICSDNRFGDITILDLASGTEEDVVLETAQGGGLGYGFPSWSPGGEKISFSELVEIDSMYASYNSRICTTDTTGSNLSEIVDSLRGKLNIYTPSTQWLPSGNEISYTWHYDQTENGQYKLKKYNLANDSESVMFAPYVSQKILDHSWSPLIDKVAISLDPTVNSSHIFTYSPEKGFLQQITEDDSDSLDIEEHCAWSPDNRNIAFLENASYLGDYSWRLFVKGSKGEGEKRLILGSDYTTRRDGLSWFPDGTKLVFLIEDGDSVDLYCTDFIRGADAYPGANIQFPLSDSTIIGEVAIIGTVSDNHRAEDDSVISVLDDYYIKYSMNGKADGWNDEFISYSKDCGQGDCQIVNDTLATWNTSFLQSGEYTVCLCATDGVDSNMVYRRVIISHNNFIVKQDGTEDFTTISSAMDAAIEGDTILIESGDYDEDNIELKEGIKFAGVSDSVRILVDSGHIGLKVYDHEHPCRICNLTIRSSSSYVGDHGIHISNSDPDIISCKFENFDGGASWGAVAIDGNSYPKFSDCVFTENEGNIATVWVNCNDENEISAPKFYSCKFTGNNASGKLITLDYNNSTPLDSTHNQPLFNNCKISDNSSSSGGLIGIYNCHAPVFSWCEITDNEIESEGILRGQIAGVRTYSCTFAGNICSSQYNDAPVFHFSMMNSNTCVDIEKCIIAFEDDEAIDVPEDKCEINYSCLFGESPEDTLWANNGTGNIMDDPAFCDSKNGIYTLYNFSSCLDIDGYGCCMGACAVACTPACDSLSLEDDYVVMCPAGDRDSLLVHVDFVDSVMTRTIDADEIWMQKPPGDSISFFRDGSKIYADSAATEANGWHTTITRKFGGGYCEDSLTVGLIEEVLDKLPVTIKSPDYIVNGTVDLSDYAAFGSTWAKCEGDSAYNKWFDFIKNDCVDISDYALFGSHWQCSYNDSLGATLASGNITGAQLNIVERDDDSGIIKIKVSLTSESSYRTLALMLKAEDYRFINWNSDRTIAVPVERHDENCIFIGSIGTEENSAADSELGIITLKQENVGNADLENGGIAGLKGGISLIGGELMRPDGKILWIDGGEVKDSQEPVIYTDRLYDNYPNPFNPITTIRYSVSKDCRVKLKIFNVKGQLIKTLVDGFRKTGGYEVKWNGTNNRGGSLASGVYFYRLEAGQFTETKKMVLLR